MGGLGESHCECWMGMWQGVEDCCYCGGRKSDAGDYCYGPHDDDCLGYEVSGVRVYLKGEHCDCWEFDIKGRCCFCDDEDGYEGSCDSPLPGRECVGV